MPSFLVAQFCAMYLSVSLPWVRRQVPLHDGLGSSSQSGVGQGPKHWVAHKLKEKLMTLSYSVQPAVTKHHSLVAYKLLFRNL